ncbi:MAG: archaellin/type IV pilin N-terminal domain-containing protein [Thermoplasmata archaeon]
MKYVWKKNEKAVSPVIATILMVAITVVLAAVLVVYMRNYGKDPGKTDVDKIKKVVTKEGRNWNIRITSADGVYNIMDCELQANTQSNVKIYNITLSSTSNRVTNDSTSTVGWYCYGAGKSPEYPAGTALPQNTNIAQAISSILNAYVTIIDNNKNNQFDADDTIYVYGDYNNDNSLDLQAENKIQIKKGDQILMEAVLG